MRKYLYEAKTASGTATSGYVDAISVADARERLKAQGFLDAVVMDDDLTAALRESAVEHGDMVADSDVDMLVRYKRPAEPGLRGRGDLPLRYRGARPSARGRGDRPRHGCFPRLDRVAAERALPTILGGRLGRERAHRAPAAQAVVRAVGAGHPPGARQPHRERAREEGRPRRRDAADGTVEIQQQGARPGRGGEDRRPQLSRARLEGVARRPGARPRDVRRRRHLQDRCRAGPRARRQRRRARHRAIGRGRNRGPGLAAHRIHAVGTRCDRAQPRKKR